MAAKEPAAVASKYNDFGEHFMENCTGFDCLHDYVNHDDGMYKWVDLNQTISGKSINPLSDESWTGHMILLTSQQWLTPEDTSRSTWWHILCIIIPSTVNFDNDAFLWITGDNNDNFANTSSWLPKASDEDIIISSYVAMQTHTVGAALFQVPNQHMVFSADILQKHRSEDAVIAFTWYQFVLNNTNLPNVNEWPLRLPMTKSAVKAFDCITEFMDLHGKNVTNFYVAGASKRGWTTWTTAAVDPRVVGMMPVVMDELNFVKNIQHHYQSYGGWSFALDDYTALNFTQQIDNPRTQMLMDIVDPFSYRERLTMPKLVINSCMDEFFLPDDTHYWWRGMPGPKHFLIVPNAEHSEATGVLELLPAVATYMTGLQNQRTIPTFTWNISNTTGDIVVHTDTKLADSLVSVKMWHATTCNNKRRDFRVINAVFPCECGFEVKDQNICANLGVFWTPQTLEENPKGSGIYTAHRDVPAEGKWTAFMVDVQYKRSADGYNYPVILNSASGNNSVGWPIDLDHYEFTTGVSVIPHTFPFPQCHGTTGPYNCTGVLV
jgi:PhoPQ-activated pathogenicity-related protein